jgi:CRP-like cAMP-binding protein/phosphoribosyl 1,2-cyclic phosphodiesterase
MADQAASSKPLSSEPYVELPRGGFLLETSQGAIQFGVPPETIKDTMRMPMGVPTLFVLPKDFFHIERGISIAEIEFPIYFNFFIRQKKVRVVCRAERINDFKVGLTEALFGPEELNIEQDIVSLDNQCIPDMRKEMDYFRRGLELDTVVEFIPLTDEGVTIGDVYIQMDADGNFAVQDQGIHKADIPGYIHVRDKYETGKLQKKPFIPPRMGITCLGPSHGFDPTQNTSGFILWLNNRGIMIDPPVASTEWLHKSNVNPKYIDSIILTHCHADHDAGTFQKILAEEKITIYTTQTIMDSFLKKYSSLTKIPERQLQEMFYFHPVRIGESLLIHQGRFDFFYSLHSIPTIGFTTTFRGKSFLYSSDHLNEPDQLTAMYEQGVFPTCRYEQLLNYPWDCDIIYHEAGVPPLHTPVQYLNNLPEAIQKKIMVYHIAEKDFPSETKLTLATFGIGNTKIIDVPESPYDSACDILHILEKVEYFNSFNLSKIHSLLSVLKLEQYKAGEVIIQKGTEGDRFYIITSGKVLIEDISSTSEKRFGDYETFGEASLLTNTQRNATVRADTNVTCITIEKHAFLELIKDTDLEKKLALLVQHRSAETWDTLAQSSVFRNTTSFQRTAFEMLLVPMEVQSGDILIERNHSFDKMFLIQSGEVERKDPKGRIKILKRGDLVGDIARLQKRQPAFHTYRVCTPGKVYYINQKDMLEYVETYPNTYMNLLMRGDD